MEGTGGSSGCLWSLKEDNEAPSAKWPGVREGGVLWGAISAIPVWPYCSSLLSS